MNSEPRIQYERTYVLLPPNADRFWVHAVIESGVWDIYRWTIGGSADDAGMGALSIKRVIAVNPGEWPGDLHAFFNEHYSGVLYETVTADTPEELRAKLAARYVKHPTPNLPFVTYSQRDALWASEQLDNIDSTIGKAGCALTASAMILTQYDSNITPKTLNRWLIDSFGYTNDGRIIWGIVGNRVADIDFVAYHTWNSQPADMRIVDRLVQERPTILKIDFVPGGEVQSHFVVAVRRRTYNDFDIVDPWTGQVRSLRDVYGGDRPLEEVILAAVEYEEVKSPYQAKNLFGLHMQRPDTDWPQYVTQAEPTVMKFVNQLGMCVESKQTRPETAAVFRWHLTSSEQGDMLYKGNRRDNARDLLDTYSYHFETYARNSGMSVEEVLRHVDIIESLNEMIGTHDPDMRPAVEFDIYFMEEVRNRYGFLVDAGVLCLPVGNPGYGEFEDLLPAAAHAYEYGHFLGYHGYWPANRHKDFIDETWFDLAARWMKWDTVFRSYQVYPKYYLGEVGVVSMHDDNPYNLGGGLGWKGMGSFSRYIMQIDYINAKYNEWNRTHDNRLLGATIFCYGTDDGQWDSFDFEAGDLYDLIDWGKQYADS